MKAAEFPKAILIPAHPGNYREANRSAVARVVIHITSGHGHAKDTAGMFAKPQPRGKRSSAHYIVGQDIVGDSIEIVQSVLHKALAQHAGDASADRRGLEHGAREPREFGPNDKGLPVSDAMYRASAELTAWLCALF